MEKRDRMIHRVQQWPWAKFTRKTNVGGGYTPIAVGQLQISCLTHRYRGQAPSHIFSPALQLNQRFCTRSIAVSYTGLAFCSLANW